MKRIIVDVDGLTNEEKQRVNEALAKIKNVRMCKPTHWDDVVRLHGPSFDGIKVGFDYHTSAKPTHAPQQVLEMAGMAERRKVRKDFDLTREYSVDVSGCTEEEKEEVQQAFFDVGIKWLFSDNKYTHLNVNQYSNALSTGEVGGELRMSTQIDDCNMTAQEFLELVYEPEDKEHGHADLVVGCIDMNKINDEIKQTLNLMQTDIVEEALNELQYHLSCLLEIKRKELQQQLSPSS